MGVQLLAIKFNYDSGSANADALNIRKNATQFVTVPEWQFGVSVNPEDSPAAYALAPTEGNTIKIQAKFRRTGEKNIETAEIRALDPTVDPPAPHGCLEYILWLIRIIIRALFGNVLGDVKAKTVTFQANGETAFETFELQHVRLWDAGVGIRTTNWRWQYRIGGGGWTDFQNTTHRIYSVLDVPTSPWQQTPYNNGNTQLPWTEALDYACGWAFLTSDKDEAAGRVTSSVFNLGPSVITYDCPGGGSSNYSWGTFNCTAFLDKLKGGPGLGIYVNCSDCATFTSTFSNILGCDLWQSTMSGNQSFTLNPMLGIGSNVWQPCCGWVNGFSYHEVAWKGACDVNDHIFDACLEVDGDANPSAAPHTALLPVNMRFGNQGQDYRFRLATPAGQANCNPQPGSRQRRVVV